MKKYLETGKIVAAHGVRGEVRVQPWSDSPDFLCGFKTLYINSEKESIKITNARVHKNIVIIKIKGVDNIDDALLLRGSILYVDRAEVKLEKGSYFIQDLIGIKAIDFDSGEELGELSDITATGANDVYHIKLKNGKTLLIPAIEETIKEIDIENSKIIIHVLNGLEAI